MPSRNDYKILLEIYKYGCINEMKSITINKIQELTDLSLSKIRTTLSYFKDQNYVAEGVMQHSAKTYYITAEGIVKIHQIL